MRGCRIELDLLFSAFTGGLGDIHHASCFRTHVIGRSGTSANSVDNVDASKAKNEASVMQRRLRVLARGPSFVPSLLEIPVLLGVLRIDMALLRVFSALSF